MLLLLIKHGADCCIGKYNGKSALGASAQKVRHMGLQIYMFEAVQMRTAHTISYLHRNEALVR
jgi:hypothetical protein